MLRLVLALLSLVLLARPAPAQRAEEDLAPPPPDTTAARLASSRAVVALLTEDGLAGGVAARRRLTDDLSLTVEASLGAARDPREQRFFVGFFGETVTPFKRSYAVLLPMHLGLERRLFRRTVEDTFRPFVSVAAGPTVAVQWPYFDDANGNGLREAGEARLSALAGLGDARLRPGAGMSVGLGAWVGRGPRRVHGVRLAAALHYIPAGVDLLETDPAIARPSRRTFLSPTVSFFLARPGE